jgi:hypothetical protein
MSLLNNHCVLEPLGHELRTEINTTALKIVLILLIYLNFSSLAHFNA